MAAVAELLAKMRARHDDLNRRLAGMPEEQMRQMGAWGQTHIPIRTMFYRVVIHETEHTVQVVKTLQTLGLGRDEVRLILGQLQQARGALEGLLIGLSDEELDRAPEGEWSVHQVLEHMMEAEGSYSRRLDQALAEAKG